MSDETKKPGGPEYTVDEILAEYGSKGRGGGKEPPQREAKSQPPKGRRPQKVVDFPTEKLPRLSGEEGEGPSGPPAQGAEQPARQDKPMPEIVPENVGRAIGAHLHTLLRRADHFADHMYDQAEPDPEALRAEKYIPGVDKEELPPEEEGPDPSRRPRLRLVKPRELPPDVPPAKLSAQYAKGLKGQGVRVRLATLTALAAALCSVDLPVLSWSALAGELAGLGLEVFQLRCWVLSGLLALTGLLCYEIAAAGAKQFFTLRPRAESILLFALLFTLADGLTAPRLEGRAGFVPFSAVTALGLAFALRGEHQRRRGDRVSAKTAAQSRTPYMVSLDGTLWSNKPTYTKLSGSSLGFGSRLQMEDGGHAAYRFAAPLLLLGAMLCAIMASVGQKAPERFLWAASACFTACASWPALLAFALPYSRLAQRLSRVGAALAGWAGAARCGRGGVIVSDLDLFPTGSVSVAQVKVFGGAATEKVVGYTATMLRLMDCGLTRPFHDLLRAHGALYREVSGLEWHEGGAVGVIRNQEVLVGTAAYMHLMEVPIPPGHNIKNAVFCAINGQLSGLFLLNYAMSGSVNPSLSAFMKAGVAPVLATRDPNLIPALLEQKFKLPVDKMEFPPVGRRLELSKPDPEEVGDLVALLTREGLIPYCDAVVGGRRLRLATRWGLALALAGSVIGLCLTFYLTSVGAFASLTVPNLLVFMAAWLVPQWLITNWVNQY
mgnify:FL=1